MHGSTFRDFADETLYAGEVKRVNRGESTPGPSRRCLDASDVNPLSFADVQEFGHCSDLLEKRVFGTRRAACLNNSSC
jgi:hypothetical protein